jgi:ABC-type nickel/cobalt efflux system permease component RcnA
MLTGSSRRNTWLVPAALILVFLPGLALAQSSLGIGTAEPAFNSSGFLGGFLDWVNAQQQGFYRALSGAVKEMRDDPAKLWSLIGLSFAYGVFHAAGPGHGKAVISSYVIANEQTLRRGITISFMAALMQGLVAILIVGITYIALRGTGISMTRATHTLEIASYALIAGFGGWLLFRKLRPKSRHSHHHDEHHDHAIGPDGVCNTCGHSHAPDPAKISAAKLELREAWSAILAIGLRPCSGALIVLTFALLNGLYLGGFLSVTAMSIGTAITVSVLATMAVVAKSTAVRFASSQSAAARITGGIEILGAASVLILGIVLLFAALQV